MGIAGFLSWLWIGEPIDQREMRMRESLRSLRPFRCFLSEFIRSLIPALCFVLLGDGKSMG